MMVVRCFARSDPAPCIFFSNLDVAAALTRSENGCDQFQSAAAYVAFTTKLWSDTDHHQFLEFGIFLCSTNGLKALRLGRKSESVVRHML